MSTLSDDILAYLTLFHAKRDYFECHEVLEHTWQQAPVGERSLSLAALIQISVAMYHYRRQNINGTTKLLTMAKDKIYNNLYEFNALGFDGDATLMFCEHLLNDVANGVPYKSPQLPLQPTLLDAYTKHCAKLHCSPFVASDLSDTFLLDKHIRRFDQDSDTSCVNQD